MQLADHAVGRSRAAVGIGVADLDLGVGRAVVVLLLRQRHATAESAVAADTPARKVRLLVFMFAPCVVSSLHALSSRGKSGNRERVER